MWSTPTERNVRDLRAPFIAPNGQVTVKAVVDPWLSRSATTRSTVQFVGKRKQVPPSPMRDTYRSFEGLSAPPHVEFRGTAVGIAPKASAQVEALLEGAGIRADPANLWMAWRVAWIPPPNPDLYDGPRPRQNRDMTSEPRCVLFGMRTADWSSAVLH